MTMELRGEEFFMSKNNFVQSVKNLVANHSSAVGVLTKTPFSVFVALYKGAVYVCDSHLHFVPNHGCHGGLIAVPGPTLPVKSNLH